MADDDSRYEELHFKSQALRIGSFRISPEDENFRHAGRIVSGHVVVFPQIPVLIRHEGAEPFVADPNTAVYHNRGYPYQRFSLSDEGDRSHFFSFPSGIVSEALARFDPDPPLLQATFETEDVPQARGGPTSRFDGTRIGPGVL